MSFDYGFDYHEITEGYNNGNEGKKLIRGTPLRARMTYAIIKSINDCELREYRYDDEISCYEIHCGGELYQKYTKDKNGSFKSALKEALCDFKFYSAA